MRRLNLLVASLPLAAVALVAVQAASLPAGAPSAAPVLDASPRAFERAVEAPCDDTASCVPAVTVTYWTGVEPCSVLDRVDVVETSESVTLTVFEGWQRDGAGERPTCIMLAVQRQVTVVLDAPLAARAVIDGAVAEQASEGGSARSEKTDGTRPLPCLESGGESACGTADGRLPPDEAVPSESVERCRVAPDGEKVCLIG